MRTDDVVAIPHQRSVYPAHRPECSQYENLLLGDNCFVLPLRLFRTDPHSLLGLHRILPLLMVRRAMVMPSAVGKLIKMKAHIFVEVVVGLPGC